MFRAAYAIASQFTWPVILSRKTANGKCTCSIGSCVVINPEGWIITAFHLAKQYSALMDGDQAERVRESAVAAVRADQTIDDKERRKRLSAFKAPGPKDTVRGSGWWGRDGASLTHWIGIEAADIAIGKLEPFDPSWVSSYPMFKDPTKDFEPGASLCKLGYPFHQITPSFDEAKNGFVLPAGAVPLPRFPIDGILTRIADIEVPDPPPYALRWVETSSPGLKGQSGGPIFDTQGTIWAIQVQTAHFPLGFDPPVPNSQKGEKEHQFLNVGLGVHPETMFGLMKDQGVSFKVSPY